MAVLPAYLDTDTKVKAKTTARAKKTVKAASAGKSGAGRPVVEFRNHDDGRKHTKGPAGSPGTGAPCFSMRFG